MNGHILPHAIQMASRATVIQRADVDNDFGKLEAELSSFLNRPYYEVKEFYKRARGLTITGSDGIPLEAFFASKKSAPPFPQVALTDKKGKIIATPFVRTSMDRAVEFDGPVDVQGEISFSIPALTVSLVKAAHLALFKLLGYDWVFHAAGQYVANRLAKLIGLDVNAGLVSEVARDLPNCFNLLPGPAAAADTLSSRLVVFHYDHFNGVGHPTEHGKDAWGVSCVLNLNEHTFVVTLPFAFYPDRLDLTLTRYRRHLSEPDGRHSIFSALVRDDGQVIHSKTGQTITFQRERQRDG